MLCLLLLPRSALPCQFLGSWCEPFLCNVLFLLSTTPFCYGVLGQEKSWEMPLESKRFSKSLFSNSPPRSLLTLTILQLFSFCTWVQKVENTECDSSLLLRNFTHVQRL